MSTKWRPNPRDPLRAMTKKLKNEKIDTLRWLIIVPGGLITSPRGGPGGPGTGFCSPGGGFSGSRRSGKPLRLLRLKQTPPGLQKQVGM